MQSFESAARGAMLLVVVLDSAREEISVPVIVSSVVLAGAVRSAIPLVLGNGPTVAAGSRENIPLDGLGTASVRCEK